MAHRVPGGWPEGGPCGSPRDEAGRTPGAWASGLTRLWPRSPHSTCSPGSCACPAWSPCWPCSRTSQISTRSWCSKWSSSPRTCLSSGVWPPLPFRKKTLQEIIIPLPPHNKVTQQTSPSLGLSQPQALSLAIPSQGSCCPLGSSGLTPASAGPCPWRTRSPSSRGPL